MNYSKYTFIIAAIFVSKAGIAQTTFLKKAENLNWIQESGADVVWKKSTLSDEREQKDIDSCLSQKNQPKTFGGAIESAVRLSLDSRIIKTDIYIQEGYGIAEERKTDPVGLLSNPLCEQDRNQIAAILGESHVPDEEAIKFLKDFTQTSNLSRDRALKGDSKELKNFVWQWTTLMSCLAYAESLDTAHKDASHDAFSQFIERTGTSNFFYNHSAQSAVKPNGVLFGLDRRGEYYIEMAAAKKNGTFSDSLLASLEARYPTWPVVGLYQFNANPVSNISPCVGQWNELISRNSCEIDRLVTKSVFTAFSSHGQSVNAFCGVQKIVQSFNSQVNTKNTTGVDLSNLIGNRIKKPKDRCVSLVARAGGGRIYSHFGPFRNSVGYNLKKVMECTMNAMKKTN